MKKTPILVISVIALLLGGALGCTGRADVPPPRGELPEKTRSVSVFYATGNTLVEERHVVKDGKDIITTTLNELLAAKPEVHTDIAIVQPECTVLGVSVSKEGVASVDFSGEVLDFEATKKEKVLAYAAILETLKQFENIKSVKFTVEGREKGLFSGKDIHKFWVDVSLIGQPWKINRTQPADDGSGG